jgi:hypothetical protein
VLPEHIAAGVNVDDRRGMGFNKKDTFCSFIQPLADRVNKYSIAIVSDVMFTSVSSMLLLLLPLFSGITPTVLRIQLNVTPGVELSAV